ncbi:MAG: BatA domain-containing protein [Bryobacteraceae bacterium]
MGFLAPWFLAGALAVGVPVWLHLLRQHKSVPLPFSSLMFFERRTQSSVKHRRLRYLLLLALRALLIVVLALAFSKPFTYMVPGLAGSGQKMVVIALDDSFSMRQGDRMERARSEALQLVGGIGAGNKAQVLAFSSGVRMMSDPTDDVAVLRAAISSIVPGDGRGSYAELTRALRSIAQSSRMPVEAHLFSDLQKSSLPSSFADVRLGDGIRLVTHPAATGEQPNFAVESVNAPRRVYDPKKVRIQATVVGYGAERGDLKVSVHLNNREIGSKTLSVPASGRATFDLTVPSLDAPHGFNRGEVRIESRDGFPGDDRYLFSIERADPRPALFVHETKGARSLLYFRAALEASTSSAFVIDAVRPEQAAGISPSRYAFILLSDVSSVPPAFEEALRKYVRAGGSLWIALGRAAAVRNRVPVFDENIAEAVYASRSQERFQTVAWLDPAHPSIRRANRWDGVKFYQVVRVEPGKARVAARLSDDTPLLLEKQVGEGRVLVFASTLDNISNDFPLHASFVPFIEQTSRYLGRIEESGASHTVGTFLELRTQKESGAAVEVLDPQGRRALSLEEAARAETIELASAGFYDVRRPSGRHELVAVNPDRHESDLAVIPAETLALWQNTGQGSKDANPAAGTGVQAGDERKPSSFWWYVMLSALILAVAESLVGNRHLNVEEPVERMEKGAA